MTRDDIIAMVREAVKDPDRSERCVLFFGLNGEQMFRFAALVVAAEREQCLAVVKEYLRAARFDHRHLGLGDIKLTIGDEENIEAAIRAKGQV